MPLQVPRSIYIAEDGLGPSFDQIYVSTFDELGIINAELTHEASSFGHASFGVLSFGKYNLDFHEISQVLHFIQMDPRSSREKECSPLPNGSGYSISRGQRFAQSLRV